MNNRDKKLDEYLKESKRVQEEREDIYQRFKKKKKVKNYAENELPEMETVKKAANSLFSFFRRKKEKRAKKKLEKKKIEIISPKFSSPQRRFLFFKRKDKDKKNQEEKKTKKIVFFLEKGISFCLFSVVFLIPLSIVPFLPSPLELPKQAILSFFTGLAMLLWLMKMIISDKIEFKKSFLFIPIMAFVFAYVLSGVFSVYPDRSIWGYFKGEESSLFTTIFFILYFFVLTNNISSLKKTRRILFLALLAGFLAALFASLQLWGIHLIEIAELKDKTVNTIGTSNASTIYFAGLAILVAGVSIFSKRRTLTLIYFIFASGYLSFLSLVFEKGIWTIFILAAGLVLAVGITQKKINPQKTSLFVPLFVFAFSLLTFLIGKPLLNSGTSPVEALLNTKKSIEIAFYSIKENPFLGSGPDTFIYQYELFKPEMGYLSSIGINQPSNHILLLFSTTGLLTFASYLFLLFVFSRFTIANAISVFLGKNKRGDAAVTALGICWIFLTAASFIYLSNTAILFFWWFSLAIIDINRPVRSFFSSVNIKEGIKENAFLQVKFAKTSLILAVIFVSFFALFITLMYLTGKRSWAAYYYQKALNDKMENRDMKEVSLNIEKSVKLDNKKDLYFRNMAIVYLTMSKERISETKGEFTGSDSKFISDHINRAITNGEKAIELNPKDFENYRNQAWIYQEIGGLGENFGEKSLSHYQKALELSPNNPDLFYQISNLYLDLYNTEVAKAQQQKTEPGPKAREYLLSAEENLKKALDVNKFHFGANVLLATIYDMLEEQEAAFQKTKDNWGVFLGNPQAGFSLAVQYYKRDQFQSALEILNSIIKDNPDYSNAHYLLGICYAQLGELGKSLNHFEQVQESNPENQFIQRIVDQLIDGKTDFLTEIKQGNLL